MPIVEVEDNSFHPKSFRSSVNPDYKLLENMKPKEKLFFLPPEHVDTDELFNRWRNALGAKCRKLGQQRNLVYTVTVGEAKCSGGPRQVVRVECNSLTKTKAPNVTVVQNGVMQ